MSRVRVPPAQPNFLKEVQNRSRVPVGGYWKYIDAETGALLQHPYLHELEKLAKKHRIANNLPIGSNWTNDFEANICAQQPESCGEAPPDLLDKAGTLALALYRFAKSGFKVASEEIVAARLAICEKCEFWRPGKKLLYGRCEKCGCAARLKLPMLSESCPINLW